MWREDGNIAKAAFVWNPQGTTRRISRPRITRYSIFRNEIKTLGKSWMETKALTKNRILWRAFIKALRFPEEWEEATCDDNWLGNAQDIGVIIIIIKLQKES